MGILDAPAAPLLPFRRLQARGPVPVATRAAPPFQPTSNLSDGTVMGGTSRVRHVATHSAHGLVLGFTNTYNSSGTETDGPSEITVRASVEPASGYLFPVFFGGRRDAVIPPGATVWSDPVGLSVAKGAAFWTRTHLTVASPGHTFPRGGFVCSVANGEGHDYAASPVDKTTSGSVSTSVERVYGPCSILGSPTSAGADVIGIVGDSIASGTGDTGANLDVGFIVRALGGSYGFQRVAYGSETPDGWMQQNGSTRWRRAAILERVGLTAIICELGVNGLSNPSQQANLALVWAYLATFGVPVYQTTITPVTTSTDGWVTTGNQTPGANEAARVALNTYIRTVPAPLAGIFEVADLAETSRNSGIWRAGYSGDGTHPNAVGHAALAPSIDPTSLWRATT